jgi:hypothetical protein
MNIREKIVEILNQCGESWIDTDTHMLDYLNVREASERIEGFINSNFELKKADKLDWIDEWLELFPKGVKSGGKLLRSDRVGCLKKMQKFLQDNKKYSKDIIMNATKNYIEERREEDFNYTKCATYFINKEGQGSELAARCENLEEGDCLIVPEEKNNYFI